MNDEKLLSDYTAMVKANVELAHLTADLQEQLQRQADALTEALEALRFYASNDSWLSPSDPQYGDGITYSDLEENSPITKRRFVGGKRAREALPKLGAGG